MGKSVDCNKNGRYHTTDCCFACTILATEPICHETLWFAGIWTDSDFGDRRFKESTHRCSYTRPFCIKNFLADKLSVNIHSSCPLCNRFRLQSRNVSEKSIREPFPFICDTNQNLVTPLFSCLLLRRTNIYHQRI